MGAIFGVDSVGVVGSREFSAFDLFFLESREGGWEPEYLDSVLS